MADTVADPAQQKIDSTNRIKHLYALVPEFTGWLGNLNGFIHQVFDTSARAHQLFERTRTQSIQIEGYLSDIQGYPNGTSGYKIDFDIVQEEILHVDSKAKLVQQKSNEYIQQLFPFLTEVFQKDFGEPADEYQRKLKVEYDEQLSLLRQYLLPRYKTDERFSYFAAYPYFIHIFLSLIEIGLNLLEKLQDYEWKELSNAERAQLQAQRDKLISDKQKYQNEHSSGAGSLLRASKTDAQGDDEQKDSPSLRDQSADIAKRLRTETQNKISLVERDLRNPEKKWNFAGDFEDFLMREYKFSREQVGDHAFINNLESLRELFDSKFPSQATQAAKGKFSVLDQKSKISIENYATVAAYFESVPPRLLEDLRRELRISDADFAEFKQYFEYTRKQNQLEILRLNGGKLPQYMDIPDFGDPALRAQIDQMKGQVLESLVEVKANLTSKETFHKLLTVPPSQGKAELGEIFDKKKAIDDKNSEEYMALKEEEVQVSLRVALQENYLAQTKGEQPQTRFFLFGAPETPEPSQTETILESFGPSFQIVENPTISLPDLSQGDFEEEGGGSSWRNSLDSLREQHFSSPVGTKKALAQAGSATKRMQQTAQAAKALLSNPYVLAGAGAAGGLGLFLTGIATNAPGLMAAGGAMAGASTGALIGSFFGGVGAIPGFVIGGLVGGVGGGVGGYLGGSAIANSIHGGGAQTAIEGARGLGQLGSQGLSAAAKATPSVASGIAKTAGSLAGSAGQLAGAAANSGVGALANGLAALPTASSGIATSTLGATALVAGPIAGIGVVGLVMTTMIVPGAFLIDSGLDVESSKYVTLEKTATPNQAENSQLPLTVNYAISIKPKPSEDGTGEYKIVVTAAKDTYTVRSKGTPPSLPDQDVSDLVSDIGTGKTKNYTQVFSAQYQDSRITNTLQITYDVFNPKGAAVAQGQTFSTSASVRIGNPPDDVGCFIFGEAGQSLSVGGTSVEWTDADKGLIAQAYSILDGYKEYENILCAGGNITLYRGTDSQYGGWTSSSSTIVMYDLGLGSVLNTRYTLIHESGHIIATRNGSLFQSFLTSVFGSEPWIRSYTYAAKGTSSEDFPETFAVYMTFKNRKYLGNSQAICMDTEYKKHYDWAKENVFGGKDAPHDSSLGPNLCN